MSIGELSFDFPLSLSITWAIPDFSLVAEESGYSLRSPDFTFADGRHSLRLFQVKYKGCDHIGIELLNLTDTDPVVLCEVQLKTRTGEINGQLLEEYKHVVLCSQTYLQNRRDEFVPDGTLTVLCSVRRPTKPNRVGSPESGGAQARVIPECRTSSGELSFQSFPFLYVTWRIPGFSRLSRESRRTLESPEFPFSDSRCRLRLLLEENYVYVDLVDLADTVRGRYIPCDAGLKSKTGEEIYRTLWIVGNNFVYLVSRRELAEKECEIFPDGHLTVFCCMRSTDPNRAGNPESGGAESQVVPSSKAATDPKSVAVQTSNEEGREELPGSKAAAAHLKSVAVQTSNEEEVREELPGGVEKVLFDLKRLLLKGAESDACLVVGGNAFSLYAAADKYDLPTLKSECVEYMRRGLSVDNFCDVLTLAQRHHERDLLELAVEFFKKNVADIILTVKWQQFMSENSTIANELFMKLHVPGRESDDVLLP